MSSYEQLTSLVDDGDLRLINMVAVPRSMSTALGRALNEADERSIFINEPFNRNNRSLETAAQHIVSATEDMLRDDSTPVTVFTKSMAAYLSNEASEGLAEIAYGNVWSIRHPLIQIGSLVTRMANDLAVENGADQITQSTVEPYLAVVTQQLKDSQVSKDFSRTGWESIGRHFHAQDSDSFVVIDGTALTNNPREVLSVAALVLGLNFSNRMTSGWGEGYVNVNIGTSRFDTEQNGWTSHAAVSEGIMPTTREPMRIGQFPPLLREHILQIAIPTYEMMLEKVVPEAASLANK